MNNISKKIHVLESGKHGMGLFAKEFIKKDEFIGTMTGEKTNRDGIHVLWTSNKEGIIVDNILKFSNHDWENPNSYMKRLSLYAQRDIEANEEIFWDYSCGYKYEKEINLNKPLFDNIGYSVVHHSILDNNKEVFINSLQKIKEFNLDLKTNFDGVEMDLIHFLCSFGTPEFLEIYLNNFNDFLKLNSQGLNIFHFLLIQDNIPLLMKTFELLSIKEIKELITKKSNEGEYPLDYLNLKFKRKEKLNVLKFLLNNVGNESLILKDDNKIITLMDYLVKHDFILAKKVKK